MALVRRHFGALPARAPVRRTAAIEPPQRGERRLTIEGPVARQHFELAYPAPAASNPDLPAFLVMQQLLGGGSGLNFRQNDWGTPAVAGSALHGVAQDVKSWFIPTADRYLLTVTGSIDASADRAALERELERRIAGLRDRAVGAERLGAARAAVAAQLVFDVETTEDAAHQLAFFEGIGAYDVLLQLAPLVAAVGATDVQRVARDYLAPQLRTVGWYVPGRSAAQARLGAGSPTPARDRSGAPPAAGPAGTPMMRRLTGGLPVIVQPSPLTQTATVHLLVSAPLEGEAAPVELAGTGAVTRSGAAASLAELIAGARAALARAPASASPPSEDPQARLEQMLAAAIALPRASVAAPLVAVVSGAVDAASAFSALESAFGSLAPAAPNRASAQAPPGVLETLTARIDRPLPQAAIGYVVPAPAPATPDGLAWRMLLYILTHDYGGRLGDLAIRDRGLVYHIDSAYRTDGGRGWITLTTGVDPSRIDAFEAALRSELARLATDPPSAAEVAAARQHLLGRDISAAQSNAEIAARLARQFVETGGLRGHDSLAAMLREIGPSQVAAAAQAFARGTILRVDVGPRRD